MTAPAIAPTTGLAFDAVAEHAATAAAYADVAASFASLRDVRGTAYGLRCAAAAISAAASAAQTLQPVQQDGDGR